MDRIVSWKKPGWDKYHEVFIPKNRRDNNHSNYFFDVYKWMVENEQIGGVKRQSEDSCPEAKKARTQEPETKINCK